MPRRSRPLTPTQAAKQVKDQICDVTYAHYHAASPQWDTDDAKVAVKKIHRLLHKLTEDALVAARQHDELLRIEWDRNHLPQRFVTVPYDPLLLNSCFKPLDLQFLKDYSIDNLAEDSFKLYDTKELASVSMKRLAEIFRRPTFFPELELQLVCKKPIALGQKLRACVGGARFDEQWPLYDRKQDTSWKGQQKARVDDIEARRARKQLARHYPDCHNFAEVLDELRPSPPSPNLRPQLGA